MIKRTETTELETLADLLDDLGGIAPARVRLTPPPGTATEKDLQALHRRTGRMYELVDGVLVEKVMSYLESTLASDLITLINLFLREHDLGIVAGEAGAMRLMPGLVRIPDVSFVSWDQLPTRERPRQKIAPVPPALAVEVLSAGNTPKEMLRKVREYFLAGTRAVWFLDLKRRTIRVYTAPDESTVFGEGESLTGGSVLPGFVLSVRDLFARIPPGPSRKPQERRPENPRRRKPRQRG
jgi:Uma2 family endonuclease